MVNKKQSSSAVGNFEQQDALQGELMKLRYLLAATAALTLAQPVLANDVPVAGGSGDTANCYPFGCNYNGIYQQVYSASAFAGLTNFDTLTFYADPAYPGTSNVGSYTIDFYYAANPVDGLSTTFANNLGAAIGTFGVFALSGQFVGPSNDLAFNGSTLSYDPTQGDLLMSINASSTQPSRSIFLDAEGAFDSVSRVYSTNGYVSAQGADTGGLVTGFSFVGAAGAVPEPSTWAMFLVGFFGLGFAMRRRKSEQAASVSYA